MILMADFNNRWSKAFDQVDHNDLMGSILLANKVHKKNDVIMASYVAKVKKTKTI